MVTPSQTIYVWLRQGGIDSVLEPGLTSTDRAEPVAARRRITELETEPTITPRAIELLRETVPQKEVRSHRGNGQRGAADRDCCKIMDVSESASTCGAVVRPRPGHCGTPG
ncbi:hypothetical protein ETD83_13275 [Actinomadura soli]|uniref:Uncharacterized protein n=1 Tax=Actinomadura soli TaxID=2508997 RepID=A0A5C4JE34_9ACTN|nr:hypothetical protein ETD83_13275 [Actinomadura soli]